MLCLFRASLVQTICRNSVCLSYYIQEFELEKSRVRTGIEGRIQRWTMKEIHRVRTSCVCHDRCFLVPAFPRTLFSSTLFHSTYTFHGPVLTERERARDKAAVWWGWGWGGGCGGGANRARQKEQEGRRTLEKKGESTLSDVSPTPRVVLGLSTLSIFHA